MPPSNKKCTLPIFGTKKAAILFTFKASERFLNEFFTFF